MAQCVKLLLTAAGIHITVTVQVLAAWLSVQLPVNSPRKAEDGPNTLVPASMWDGVLGSWLQIGLAPEYALAGSWNPVLSSDLKQYLERKLSIP